MITTISPFLSFTGQAADALALYQRALGGTVVHKSIYGPDQEGVEGTIRHAVLETASTKINLIDVPPDAAFQFDPSNSLLVECDSREDLTRLSGILGDGGEVMMPLDTYPFADAFTWLADRFGVNWQLLYAGTAPYPSQGT